MNSLPFRSRLVARRPEIRHQIKTNTLVHNENTKIVSHSLHIHKSDLTRTIIICFYDLCYSPSHPIFSHSAETTIDRTSVAGSCSPCSLSVSTEIVPNPSSSADVLHRPRSFFKLATLMRSLETLTTDLIVLNGLQLSFDGDLHPVIR